MRLSTRLTLRWPTPLGRVAARLAEFLLRPRAPLWRHVLLLWPLAMLPSTLLLFAGVTVGILLGWTEAELLGDHLAPTPIDPFIALAVAPVVETLLLPIGLVLLRLRCGLPGLASALLRPRLRGGRRATPAAQWDGGAGAACLGLRSCLRPTPSSTALRIIGVCP